MARANTRQTAPAHPPPGRSGSSDSRCRLPVGLPCGLPCPRLVRGIANPATGIVCNDQAASEAVVRAEDEIAARLVQPGAVLAIALVRQVLHAQGKREALAGLPAHARVERGPACGAIRIDA